MKNAAADKNVFRRTQALFLLLLSLLGFALMLYLIRIHFQHSGASVCTVSATFSCDLVNTSSYSEILGVPVALPGALFFLIFGAFFFWNLLGTPPRLARIAAFTLSLFAVMFGTYLTLVEAFILKAFCIFCLLSFAIFVTIFLSLADYFGREALQMTKAYFRGEI